MKVVLTGASGFVGEGVLLECLDSPEVESVLVLGRKSINRQHPKLKELLVPDFADIKAHRSQLSQYDTCFFCAGISSLGMDEAAYTKVTYDATLHVANALQEANPKAVFHYISGGHTDSSEKGKVMWARVKGRTENALLALGFPAAYCYRPGLMKPTEGQRNFRGYNRTIKWLFPVMKWFFPSCGVRDIGKAMIYCTLKGYPQPILEVVDIQKAAQQFNLDFKTK